MDSLCSLEGRKSWWGDDKCVSDMSCLESKGVLFVL